MTTNSTNPSQKPAIRKSDLRWKTLVAYLPGMASVVNSFSSTEVQLEVYQLLISALDEKVEAEDGMSVTRSKSATKSKSPEHAHAASKEPMAIDLAEGDSIHAMAFHP